MHEYELKKKNNPEAQTYISKCCVCACVCVFVYCYIALAEGLMRHSHSFFWMRKRVKFA